HLLGAAGTMELIAAIMTLSHQAIPPTINLTHPDPECDLDYVANRARTNVAVATVMSNSFAFGGTNAVLIARRYE
ncbi:MAG: beta-ketoacyl-[acyl-carrier-protein] synthase family protein, partial [Gammaproteobacteria bacterium]